jgi:hypothetical protein
MSCPICKGRFTRVFTTRVLNKYDADFECCDQCGFIRASDPHWIGEAYSSAISIADTGLVIRNLVTASKLATVLYFLLQERGEGRYLDAAGGYGMLTRLMRDSGFDFYWSDKYSENLLARGFEYSEKIGPCIAVTAMEVLEHLTDPASFIHDALKKSGARAFFFSTELYCGQPPAPADWWYYSFPTGQHIGFFKKQTLERLAQKLGLKVNSANGLHAFSRDAFSTHLYKIATHPFISRIAAHLIRRRIGSRTLADHRTLLNTFDS